MTIVNAKNLALAVIATLAFAVSAVAGEEPAKPAATPSSGGEWAGETVEQGDAAQPDASGILGFDANEYFAEKEGEENAADDEPEENLVPQRRRLVIRELTHNADWDTDPTALPALVDQYKRQTGLEAYAFVPRAGLNWNDPEIYQWPLLYITGHNAFTLTDEDAAAMNRYVRHGGFLFVEDCLYGFPFGKAAHSELRKVFPELAFERIDHTNEVYKHLYSMKYSWPQVNEAGLPEPQRPTFWEAIFIDGRIAVLYTTQDLGCQWEISSPPTPSNPLGGAMHNQDRIAGQRETGYALGINILLYILTH